MSVMVGTIPAIAHSEVDGLNVEQMRSLKCFVFLQFANEALRREFVVKKRGGALLSKQDLSQKVDQIHQEIIAEVQPAFGAFKSVHCLLIIKETREVVTNGVIQGLFHRISVVDDGKGSRVVSSSSAVLPPAVERAHQDFAQMTGFPQDEPLFQDSEFTCGKHFLPLM